MRSRLLKMLLLFALAMTSGLLIPAGTSADTASVLPAKGIITGRILIKGGGPLGNAAVHLNDDFITPPAYNRVRRPPNLTVKTDNEGRFSAELPAGRYSLQVIKRAVRNNAGPLTENDYVYYGVDGAGKLRIYTVTIGETTDIGTIADAVLYNKSEDIVRTAIEGFIRDTQGNPVEGMVVFALTDYSLRTRPLYYSIKSDGQGKYLLRVPAGTYYLRARNRLKGGTPESGTYVGMFGGLKALPVTVSDGEIRRNADITVMKIRERGPAGRGPGTGPPPQ